MNEQIVQLTQMLKISNNGHILYIYDEVDRYVQNAVSYIKTGIELGNHLLIAENKDRYELIYQQLQETLSDRELDCVHFIDNCYGVYGNFDYESIFQHFQKVVEPFQEQRISFRTWSHIEYKEQGDILSLLIDVKNVIHSTGVISVCAYDGNQISATLQNHLLRNHEYFMTDDEIVKSNLYKQRNVFFPSFSEQRDHKRVEEQLKATKHQLNSFIMHNLNPIILVDMEDKLVGVNCAFEKTFGWTACEMLGLSITDVPFVPENRKFEVSRNRSFLILGETVESYETVRKTKDGRDLNVMVSSFPLWEKEDKVNGWAVIINDITDRKQAQDVLIRTEKLSIAGELAASIAHEIRNPITTVKGFLQLLQTGSDENRHYFYRVMASEIDRIELILSELLMLAKPQVSHFQQKNISLLIKDVVALLVPQANMNNVIIKMELESDGICVNCEGNQIKQAFINFIKNAVDSMPNGGELFIQMEKVQQELHIRFIDQGSGIPDHLLSKLGQPFYTTKEKGTGLGFMVSKKIIENHHGSIHISSKENKGTTIEVRLPLQK